MIKVFNNKNKDRLVLKSFGLEILQKATEIIPDIQSLVTDNVIDLVILTGSFVKGQELIKSDVDLFIIIPLSIEVKYKLKPEYIFELNKNEKNYQIEISFVTTEKLLSDQYSKNFMFWWNESIEIFSKSKILSDALLNASEYKDCELKEKIWTLNFLFKLGIYDIEKNSIRFPEGNLTNAIVYYDCLKNFTELYLLSKGIVSRFSSFEQSLNNTGDDFFLKKIHSANTFEIRMEVLNKCNNIIDEILLKFNFSKDEVINWNKCNLTKLNFQKY